MTEYQFYKKTLGSTTIRGPWFLEKVSWILTKGRILLFITDDGTCDIVSSALVPRSGYFDDYVRII